MKAMLVPDTGLADAHIIDLKQHLYAGADRRHVHIVERDPQADPERC